MFVANSVGQRHKFRRDERGTIDGAIGDRDDGGAAIPATTAVTENENASTAAKAQ